MKKVLIIISTSFVSYGGLATVMMNYYTHMDLDNIQIDFASNNTPDNKILEMLRGNSKYYNLGKRKNIFQYMHNLYKLVRKEQYDIVHLNGNSSTMVLELSVARFAGVKKRIAHVHNTRSGHPVLNKLLHPLFKKSYTDAIAVSKDAGDWLYGNNYIVLNNAIDTKKYAYNESLRDSARKELNIKDEFIIGNIGKLSSQKNQTFLLDVFAEYKKINKLSKLLIGGGGELESELKSKAKKLGLINDVIFLGMLTEVEKYLQVFDCFVFTSIYEGLGMVLIEAQASGLKCITSSAVPIETKVTDNIDYLDLETSIDDWASAIEEIRLSHYDRCVLSTEAQISIKNNGYSINEEVNKLRNIYLSI